MLDEFREGDFTGMFWRRVLHYVHEAAAAAELTATHTAAEGSFYAVDPRDRPAADGQAPEPAYDDSDPGSGTETDEYPVPTQAYAAADSESGSEAESDGYTAPTQPYLDAEDWPWPNFCATKVRSTFFVPRKSVAHFLCHALDAARDPPPRGAGGGRRRRV